jgi:multidrug efflux pump subunit AcrB
VLNLALSWRYATFGLALGTLIITIGLLVGGRAKFEFFPNIEADQVSARLTMPLGTPVEVTSAAVSKLEDALEQVRREIEDRQGPGQPPPIRHVLSSIGDQPSMSRGPGSMGQSLISGAHRAEVSAELALSQDRSVSSKEISDRWREMVGDIPDAVLLDFTSSMMSAGEPINIQLTGPDVGELRQIGEEVRAVLHTYPGLYDIADSFRAGKREVKLRIKPEAEVLNITQMDLARQVRQAFYGEEAQRIQRGRDDVRIMVRYPRDQRGSLGDLENMRIRAPGGIEVPFSTVAEAEIGRGYSSIDRVDRRRAINVTAKVDSTIANENEIIAQLVDNELPEIMARHPGILYSLEGVQREMRDTIGALGKGFGFALLGIFALLAVPLRSYIQPLIIMSAIPFGIVGAILGHLFYGTDMTIVSGLGIVALAGVVVNDSLILVDYINRKRRLGLPVLTAVREGCLARFRPILLTSMTTFGGLTPLLLEKSIEAKLTIPIAISLAYGVVFATFITLLMIPAEYLIIEDVKRFFNKLMGRKMAEDLELESKGAVEGE